MPDQAYKTPDVEFKRQIKPGRYRSYGHIYWKPFILVILNKVISGKKHL